MITPRKHIVGIIAGAIIAGVAGFIWWPKQVSDATQTSAADDRANPASDDGAEPSEHEIAERLLNGLWTENEKVILMTEGAKGREEVFRAELSALRRKMARLALGRSGVPVFLWNPDGSRSEETFVSGKLISEKQEGPSLFVAIIEYPRNGRVHLAVDIDEDFIYELSEKRFYYGLTVFRDSFPNHLEPPASAPQ